MPSPSRTRSTGNSKDKGHEGRSTASPSSLKENIDTADQHGHHGRLARPGGEQESRRRTPFLVKKLRDAGVVLLGKTNLSEWANFRLQLLHQWLERHGAAKRNNPYALDRNPCGLET